jgi:hypothetical protein
LKAKPGETIPPARDGDDEAFKLEAHAKEIREKAKPKKN